MAQNDGTRSPHTIFVPRWAQAVLIPVAVLLALVLLRAMSHAVFVFLMAVLLALLLNPLVGGLQRVRIPRVLGVILVYLSFVGIVVLLVVVAVPPLVSQVREIIENAPRWGEELNRMIGSVESYLVSVGIPFDVQAEGVRIIDWISSQASTLAGTVFNVGLGLAGGAATLFLVIIISFYMLVDGRRIHGYLCRILPGDNAVMARYLNGLQTSFTRYIKGQFLLAVSVGLGAGVGIWILGWDVVGIWPEGSRYVLLFAVWAGVTEVIPLVGPWLGGIPPFVLALFHSPAAAVAVAVVYLGVQQLENHILVPNIMGTTVGVHPLAVIFALLAGAQVGGIIGMLAVLPLLAMLKHTIDFFDVELSHEPWFADDAAAGKASEAEQPSEGVGAPGHETPEDETPDDQAREQASNEWREGREDQGARSW